jgi:putative hydrolase of the HAD superfamily
MNRGSVAWGDIEWVLVDMDGTVLDLAFDNFFWQELVPSRYAAHHGHTLEEARALLAPHFSREFGQLNWYCLDFWSRTTGLDLTALKSEVRQRVAILAGSLDFLQAVRVSGRPLWLVTNAHPQSWRIKMEQTGLAGAFDRIIDAHAIGAPKENPEFWQRLMQRHPFVRERCLFVDDSLPVLRAAQAFGVGVVRAILKPDSTLPPRSPGTIPAIDGLSDLLPVVSATA